MAQHILFKIINPDYDPNNIVPGVPTHIKNYWDDVQKVITADYTSVKPIRVGRTLYAPYQFCDGTTLNQFILWYNFPYAQQVITANSAECVYQVVCDAYIQNPLYIQNATSGQNNGAVSIRGYTSKPFKIVDNVTYVTEYSLDGTTWQFSSYFPNLAPGTYTAHMRDAGGCTDTKTFEILAEPAYGARFSTNYKDYLGVTTRIDILKRGYTGDIEQVQAAAEPLVIKERADNMFSEIRAQECTVSFLASESGQYIEMFTGDDREFKVEVYKNNALFWSGWLVPDVYLEPYLAPPFAVSFSATDGLGELKNVPFTEDLPEGLMTQWGVLMHVLKNTDSNLPITSSINLYETRMDAGPEDEPLKQATVALEAYHDNEKVLDCGQVLTAVLRSYGAFIRQYNGAWHLIRTEELKASFPRRYYNAQGEYLSYDTFAPNKLITGPHNGPAADRLFWVDRSQMLELRPAFKQTEVHIDYGLRDNLIRGGEFRERDFDSGWNHKYIDGPAGYSVELSEPKKKTYQLHLGGVPTFLDAVDFIKTERIYLKNDPLLSLYFKFVYQITASEAMSNTSGKAPEFVFSIHLNNKYLNFPIAAGSTDLEWRVNPYKFRIPTTSINTWQTAEFFVPEIPEDGWFEIRIYQAVQNDYAFVNLRVKELVSIPFRSVSPALAEDETYISLNSRKQFYAPPVVEVTHGDVIPLRNAPALYKNLILVNMGNAPSLDWQRRGMLESKPLLQLLADTMLNLNAKPVKMVRGTVKGAFDWNQVLQEATVLTRYMPVGFEYNDVANTISADFMELLGTTHEPTATLEYAEQEYNELEYN